MTEYYILVKPWAVYVKEASFFVEQGGLTAMWGSDWKKVTANSIEEARAIGMKERNTLPTGCTCGADMVPGRADKEHHSVNCPRSV